MTPAYKQEDIDNIIWSHSRVNVALQCRRKYRLQYPPKGTKKGASFRIAKGEARIGNAVHSALEELLKGNHMQRTTTQLIKRAANDNDLTLNELHRALEYTGGIERFVDRHFKWRAKLALPRDNIYIERQVAVTSDFEPAPYWPKKGRARPWFRGAWDLGAYVCKNDKRTLVIVDHKSSVPSDNMAKHEDQFRSYAILGLAHFPDLTHVLCQVHFPKTGAVLKREKQFTAGEIKRELHPWMTARVNSAIAEINKSAEPKSDWYCSYCNFKPSCPEFTNQ